MKDDEQIGNLSKAASRPEDILSWSPALSPLKIYGCIRKERLSIITSPNLGTTIAVFRPNLHIMGGE